MISKTYSDGYSVSFFYKWTRKEHMKIINFFFKWSYIFFIASVNTISYSLQKNINLLIFKNH